MRYLMGTVIIFHLFHMTGCTDAAIESVCTPADTRCSNDSVETCSPSGDGWEKAEDCPHGCQDGACLEQVCTPGDTRCSNDSVETCSQSGDGWEKVEDCPHGCQDGACLEQVCTPGDTRCSDDSVETCSQSGDGWEKTEDCAHGCENGACRPGLCSPGNIRCVEGNIETCSEAGDAWEFTRECPFGCADEQSCEESSADLCTRDGWCWVAPYPFGSQVLALWGDGTVTWISTRGGGLYRYDGTEWSANFLEPQQEVFGLWGSGADDIWAVGKDALVLHFNGKYWEHQAMFMWGNLNSIWGTAPNNIYAAGGGRLFHYDGVDWEEVWEAWVGTGGWVAGFSPNDLCVVGSEDRIKCWNGESWLEEDIQNYYGAKGVFTSADGNYWAISNNNELFLRESDGVWRLAPDQHPDGGYVWVGPDGTPWRLYGNLLERKIDGQWVAELTLPCIDIDTRLFQDPTGAIWVGSDCGYVSRLTTTWEQLSGFDQRFHGLNCLTTGDDGSLWASGEITAHYDDGNWTFWRHDLILWDIQWIDGSLYGLGIGPESDLQLVRWSGTGWDILWQGPLNFGYSTPKFSGINANEIYILADQLQRWDGTSLTPVDGLEFAQGIHGTSSDSLWAVSNGMRINYYDGSEWTLLYRHSHSMELSGVWAFADDDVWFYGGVGSFIHWDGQHLLGYPSKSLNFGGLLTPGSNGELWATASCGGFNTELIHYDGHQFRVHQIAIGDGISDVAETSTGTWAIHSGKIKFRALPTDPPCQPETNEELCLAAGFSCGAWLFHDTCGASRHVQCGVCASGRCGVGASAGRCITPPPPALDCSGTDIDSLPETGIIPYQGYFQVGLCGGEFVYLQDSDKIIHFDLATQTEIHNITMPERVVGLLVDRETASLIVLCTSTLYRIDLSIWEPTVIELEYGSDHLTLGEPGQLMVEGFQFLPGEWGRGYPVLQVVDILTGQTIHVIQKNYMGGGMIYDKTSRELFVDGCYYLHKLAYDPRYEKLEPLEYLDWFDNCGMAYAPTVRKLLSSCATGYVMDADYLVDSTNSLLSPPYDLTDRSQPAISPGGDQAVVQHKNVLEWIDLETFQVVNSVNLPDCRYPTTQRPFFSADNTVLFAPVSCGSQDQLRWVKL